ncbi:Kng2 [Phodopus roborovskii]|uniref:Kng2 protein n=1 Tax=Phodopus roborovskii TaxID=109678 RepID=A0AAU9YPQ5_PHORO|nr:Kng2 [Phodopus roborovskii]
MVGAETFYSFKYQIKEGNCSVQSGLTWQDCGFKDAEEAVTGPPVSSGNHQPFMVIKFKILPAILQ